MGEATPHSEIKRRLRDAGLRVTAGRVGVYSHLLDAGGALRHGDLVAALDHLNLDKATVYRNLMDLTHAGLVVRTDLGDHTWRFEASGVTHAGESHPHFVCTLCGDVQCLEDLQVAFSDRAGNRHDVGAKHVQVQLRGTCDNCV